MDELEISGKRYITSKRAAKEHKYHPDYIGQLVRSGKIIGEKVGRVWYVDAVALESYFNEEGPFQVSPIQKKVESSDGLRVILDTPEKETLTTNAVEKSHTVHIQIEKDFDETSEVIASDESAQDNLTHTVGLTYVADDSALFPNVPNKTPKNMDDIASSNDKAIRTRKHIESEDSKRRPLRSLIIIFSTGTVVLLVSFVLSTIFTRTLIMAGSEQIHEDVKIDFTTLLH